MAIDVHAHYVPPSLCSNELWRRAARTSGVSVCSTAPILPLRAAFRRAGRNSARSLRSCVGTSRRRRLKAMDATAVSERQVLSEHGRDLARDRISIGAPATVLAPVSQRATGASMQGLHGRSQIRFSFLALPVSASDG